MLQRLQLRHEDCTDGTRIDCAVGMPAGTSIDRTSIQAGSTTNTMQRLPSLLIFQYTRPPIVEQDHVKLVWSVVWIYPGPDGNVRAHAFAGGRPRQHVEENFKVLKCRDDFLNSHQADQDVRQGEAHAAVALAFDHHQRAGFSNCKVRSAHPNLYSQKFFAEIASCGFCQFWRFLSQIRK